MSVISKHHYFGKDIVVVKAEYNFFMNIEYNNRTEVSRPFFFRSDNFRDLKTEEIINNCLYEKEIIIGNFKKSIVKLDTLKLLENIEISNVIIFYTDRNENFIEEILQLRPNVLDINAEYISKIEISFNK